MYPKRGYTRYLFRTSICTPFARGSRMGIGLRTIAGREAEEKERKREREWGGERDESGEEEETPPHALRRGGGERERGCARHGMDRRTGERRRSFRGWSGCHGSYPGRAQQTPVLPRRSPSARRLCLPFPSRRCCCSFVASFYAFEPRNPAISLSASLFFCVITLITPTRALGSW